MYNTFVLASASPRRIELLKATGVTFSSIASSIDEEQLIQTLDRLAPDLLAQELAAAKAIAVSREHPGILVLGVDTLVALDEGILGKPADEQDAVSMLTKLSGREQIVYTGMVLTRDGRECSRAVEATTVAMRPLDRKEIIEYVQREKPYDKAGAYAIQEGARGFVEYYEGCYYNIVGLPLCRLEGLFHQCGVRLAIGPLPPACQPGGRVYL
ncbi:MAG TPA: Maf family protein [bacterium]|nr:Maf family protein [bacterium]